MNSKILIFGLILLLIISFSGCIGEPTQPKSPTQPQPTPSPDPEPTPKSQPQPTQTSELTQSPEPQPEPALESTSEPKSTSQVQEETSQSETADKEVELETPKPPTAETKKIEIKVDNWYFKPGTIEVNEGDKVELVFDNSSNTTHGVAIPGLNINKNLPGNSTQTVTFVADKKGEFDLFCNVPCGAGHKEMKGKFVVK